MHFEMVAIEKMNVFTSTEVFLRSYMLCFMKLKYLYLQECINMLDSINQ